jgi:RNA polymerase sigma factor (sigma-70 family)
VKLERMELSSSVEDLYRCEGPRLWRSILAFTGSREITDDAVSEAFMQLLGRGGSVRDPTRWIWRAAFKIAGGELARRRRPLPRMQAQTVELPEPLDHVIRALSELPPKQRAVVVLHDFADRPTEEISHLLNIRHSTVRAHLSEARRRLRSLLEDPDG